MFHVGFLFVSFTRCLTFSSLSRTIALVPELRVALPWQVRQRTLVDSVGTSFKTGRYLLLHEVLTMGHTNLAISLLNTLVL
jgi:hypothetical protein